MPVSDVLGLIPVVVSPNTRTMKNHEGKEVFMGIIPEPVISLFPGSPSRALCGIVMFVTTGNPCGVVMLVPFVIELTGSAYTLVMGFFQ